MSHQHPHRETAVALWSAVADGDAAAVRDLLAEEIVWKVCGRHPLAGEYRGPEAVLDYLAKLGENVDDLSSALQTVFFNDEGAVLVHRFKAARGARRLEMDVMLRLLIHHGKIVDALSVPVDQVESDRFWT